jgi:hypothetical protein
LIPEMMSNSSKFEPMFGPSGLIFGAILSAAAQSQSSFADGGEGFTMIVGMGGCGKPDCPTCGSSSPQNFNTFESEQVPDDISIVSLGDTSNQRASGHSGEDDVDGEDRTGDTNGSRND